MQGEKVRSHPKITTFIFSSNGLDTKTRHCDASIKNQRKDLNDEFMKFHFMYFHQF